MSFFGFAAPIRSVTADAQMTLSDYTIVALATPLTITLPASPPVGMMVHVKNGNILTGQFVTVVSPAADIDQTASITLGATASLYLHYDGAVWRIM